MIKMKRKIIIDDLSNKKAFNDHDGKRYLSNKPTFTFTNPKPIIINH